MKSVAAILNKIIIKTWYAEQAGFFFFIFLVFFGAVAPSMQLAYHYSLIKGMLASPLFLALVILAWLGYAGKTHRFVTRILSSPEYLFLQNLQRQPTANLYAHFVRIQTWLLFPVWGYALAVAGVAWHQKAPNTAVGVLVYMVLLILAGAAKYMYRLRHPKEQKNALQQKTSSFVPYWSILLRFLFAENKWLLVGIKLFSCSILYALLHTQTRDDYDLRLAYFLFSLAIFGHGLLLYRCRELQTTRLLWYRNLPVPRISRFLQVALFCFLLLIPDMLMLAWLTPDPIRIRDSWCFVFSGYSVLLLLYISAATVAMGDYLKLCLVLFGILYAAVLNDLLIGMSGLFLVTVVLLSRRGY